MSSHEESKEFRNALGDVRPLVSDKVAVRPPPPAAVPTQSRERDQVLRAAMLDPDHWPGNWAEDVETGEDLSYQAPGVTAAAMRRLRRGKVSVDAQLDLHGMTVAMAKRAVHDFVVECRQRRLRCARIVHGKGLGSRDGKPVLKQHVPGWLMRNDNVRAFVSARPQDGGTGALIVLIAQR